MGFKDLTDFNTAMLRKQLWCLIEKPNTLFSRVSKDNITGMLHPWNESVHISRHTVGGVLLYLLDLWLAND